jgi:hypothetical protein
MTTTIENEDTIDAFLRGYCLGAAIRCDGDIFGQAFSGYFGKGQPQVITSDEIAEIVIDAVKTYPSLTSNRS